MLLQACWTRLATIPRLPSRPTDPICKDLSHTPTPRPHLQVPTAMATRMDSCPMATQIVMEPRLMARARLVLHPQSTLEPARLAHSSDLRHPMGMGTVTHCHTKERTARIPATCTNTRTAAIIVVRTTTILMEGLTSTITRIMAHTRCHPPCLLTSTPSHDLHVGSLRDRMVRATVAQTARARKKSLWM